MKTVIATQSFDHGGMRRRGDVLEVSPQVADQLRRAGLVRINERASGTDPSKAAGGSSPASPAAPASRKRTAKKSVTGATETKSEP